MNTRDKASTSPSLASCPALLFLETETSLSANNFQEVQRIQYPRWATSGPILLLGASFGTRWATFCFAHPYSAHQQSHPSFPHGRWSGFILTQGTMDLSHPCCASVASAELNLGRVFKESAPLHRVNWKGKIDLEAQEQIGTKRDRSLETFSNKAFSWKPQSQQTGKWKTAITFLNTLEDTTGLSGALLKPFLSESDGFPVYLYPVGDPQSPCHHIPNLTFKSHSGAEARSYVV